MKIKYQDLIPKLSHNELELLEASIKANGCLDAIKVNKDHIILDGHNRYVICKRNNIKYNTEILDLGNESDEKLWILNNQLGRRNINDYVRSVLALQYEEIEKERSKERQLSGRKNDLVPMLAPGHIGKTREILAKKANLSHGTLDKVKKIHSKATEDRVEMLEEDLEDVI